MALGRTWHALQSALSVLLLGGIGYWLYHTQDLPWLVDTAMVRPSICAVIERF